MFVVHGSSMLADRVVRSMANSWKIHGFPRKTCKIFLGFSAKPLKKKKSTNPEILWKFYDLFMVFHGLASPG